LLHESWETCSYLTKAGLNKEEKGGNYMHKYILKRLLMLIPVILGVTFIVFFILNLSPGDPAAMILGEQATAEALEMKREELGLNDPILLRYFNYMKDLLRGDMGVSYRNSISVWEQVVDRFPNTVVLAIAGILVALLIGIPLGILSAKKQNTIIDNISMVLSLIGVSMPIFWLAVMLILLFSLKLGWFPVYGAKSWNSIVLPAISLGFMNMASIARTTRSSMVETLRQDYIRTAYSKGNSRGSALRRHVLRNAMIPVVTFLAMAIGDIMAGSIVVEQVFGVPGLGRVLISSINNRDYPVVQAIVVLLAGAVVGCNFLADLLYRVMDPRIDGR
jgi:peptide/nickel transport system permease protein